MKKGFTIIEVSLVLAIAGLIFMMVFVAVPGLQITRRDAARRELVSNVVQQIKNFQHNSNGALPSSWKNFETHYLGGKLEDPDGNTYEVVDDDSCKNNKSLNVGDDCKIQPEKYKMTVVIQAKCDGSDAVKVNNPRRAAVLYQLERGVACGDT